MTIHQEFLDGGRYRVLRPITEKSQVESIDVDQVVRWELLCPKCQAMIAIDPDLVRPGSVIRQVTVLGFIEHPCGWRVAIRHGLAWPLSNVDDFPELVLGKVRIPTIRLESTQKARATP